MNNLQGSGLTAIVSAAQKIGEPAQKHEGRLDSASEKGSSPENLVETGVALDSTVLSEGITTADLKATTERINSDLTLRKNKKSVASRNKAERAKPRSQIVSAGKLLSRNLTDNTAFPGIPQPLISAARAYKRLAYKGAWQSGMLNLMDAFLDYTKKQKLSDEDAFKLYRKLNSDVIQSPSFGDACGRTMDNFRLALTAFMPQALEQKYEKQITVIKLAADEYTKGLQQHLKELPQKLGSIELDSLAKEAALVYFQKTFEACKEEAIPQEDQKALLKYALKMKANAEFKFSTKFLLTILENPKEILGIAKDFLGGLTAKIAKDPKLSGFLHFITDSVKHGLSLPDLGRTSPQV